MRWLRSLTRITYLSKLIGTPSLAACLQLELFRVYILFLTLNNGKATGNIHSEVRSFKTDARSNVPILKGFRGWRNKVRQQAQSGLISSMKTTR
ncbi:hypothetical protein BV925_13455 [Pectobacterium odoriferum]|nr:hypothetical protein BV925_13455 [Pectobacterium odoriferum]